MQNVLTIIHISRVLVMSWTTTQQVSAKSMQCPVAQKESWSDTQTTSTGSYCEPFLNSGALHPTSKRESRQPFGEKYLYLQFDSFCLTQFVSTGESRNAGWPVNPTELTVSVPEQASTEKAIHLQIGLQLTGGC